jgi:prolyl-tRNA synthetase
MKQSHYFLKTSKSAAEDEKIISARLLKQGAFIKESVAGRYYFLPIGMKVQQKIMAVIKEEMDKVGAQEMLAPTLHPLELWKETNRTNTAGFELMKVVDRRDAEFALGGTAEEMFVDLVRKYKMSYKDLPFQLYQFSNKFRDEMRARGGLLRVREFIMKDSYSFHKDETDFAQTYEQMKQVYSRIFSRLGLETAIVESDNGYIGGEYCHEFIAESEVGESRYLTTEDGSYSAHEDVAIFQKDEKNTDEELKPLEQIAAQRGPTMEDGVAFHNLPLWQQMKDVLYVDGQGRFILAIIRGDYDVNEVKLAHVAGSRDLRPATEEEIRDVLHSEPGFISPVGLKEKAADDAEIVIVSDDSIRTVHNLYGGDNAKHSDLLNINIDRDFQADIEGDIAMAQPGFTSQDGSGVLVDKKGVEVGNVFQLGYHYTQLMKGATFTDVDNIEKPYYMGCYGIGIGRTLATIVEKYHDDKGIIWPEAIAPFKVHLISLANKDGGEVRAAADQLHQDLQTAGIEVLYDDRDSVTAGEKFADSDLIGIPYRVVVSTKTLAETSVELRKRNETESKLITLGEVIDIFKKVE